MTTSAPGPYTGLLLVGLVIFVALVLLTALGVALIVNDRERRLPPDERERRRTELRPWP